MVARCNWWSINKKGSRTAISGTLADIVLAGRCKSEHYKRSNDTAASIKKIQAQEEEDIDRKQNSLKYQIYL